MKTKYSYRRTISLVVLTFFVMLSCSKKDDGAVETITYKDDLDGTGWVVGFNKTGTLSNCIERENLDIDEELATDMTGVEFQDSTMKLIADYTEICPDESRDSWAYASKEFNEINLDPATTKQVTIKYTQEGYRYSHYVFIQLGPYFFMRSDDIGVPYSSFIDEWEITFDFEKNEPSFKLNDEVLENGGRFASTNVDYITDWFFVKDQDIVGKAEYYFKPKITFACSALDDEAQQFYPNNMLIKNLEISVTSK